MNQSSNLTSNIHIEKPNPDEYIIVEVSEPKIILGTQPIRIKAEQYKKLVTIANESGKSISDLASDLIEFALNYVKIQKSNSQR